MSYVHKTVTYFREKCNSMMVLTSLIILVIFYLLASSKLQCKVNMNEPTPISSQLDKKIQPDEFDPFVGLRMADPKLVDYVKTQILQPSVQPYNLTNSTRVHFSQYDQSEFAEINFLHGVVGGFFIEVGALDGEDKSNTLYYEKYKGWKGLLIEPNPKLYASLTSLHRKAYSIKTGLSFTSKASRANYKEGLGRVRKNENSGLSVNMVPLYTLLLALNVTQVDYFSLDIEGDEMKVLKTIPWNKIRFRLLDIEANHVPLGTKGLIKFLEPLGYTYLGNRDIDAWFGYGDLLEKNMDLDKYLMDNNIKERRQDILNVG